MNITELLKPEMDQLPDGTEKTCCICGKKFIGFGNNPYPVADTNLDDPNGLCCDECNANIVLPTRMIKWAKKENVASSF